MSKKFTQNRKPDSEDEFLWLMSLSDLMILLFIFFVVLFAFTRDKLKQSDLARIVSALKNEAPPPDPVESIQHQLEKWVVEQKLSEQIEVKRDGDSVEILIRDKVLFASAEFEPT